MANIGGRKAKLPPWTMGSLGKEVKYVLDESITLYIMDDIAKLCVITSIYLCTDNSALLLASHRECSKDKIDQLWF